jgi:O-acetyl-ADP-ribose deacetylase (regulator of RNase III)
MPFLSSFFGYLWNCALLQGNAENSWAADRENSARDSLRSCDASYMLAGSKGILKSGGQLPMPQNRMKIMVGDITRQQVDAVVNAANPSLAGGGGVDGAIHRAAGRELVEESRALAPCRTGDAKTTKGYKLPAKWVIHTVGPVYSRYSSAEATALLESAYRNALREAVRVGAKTVAFPAISTGVYGYPKDDAAAIAVRTVEDFLRHEPAIEEVRLVCFSEESAAAHRCALASRSGPE